MQPLAKFLLLVDVDKSDAASVFDRMEQSATDGWRRDHDQERATLQTYGEQLQGKPFAFFSCDSRRDRAATSLIFAAVLRQDILEMVHVLPPPPPNGTLNLFKTVLASFVESVLVPADIGYGLHFSSDGRSWLTTNKHLVSVPLSA